VALVSGITEEAVLGALVDRGHPSSHRQEC
jgi:hypothetical protein